MPVQSIRLGHNFKEVVLKTTLTCAGLGSVMVVMLGLGITHAGSGPQRAASTSGSASQQMYSLSPVASGGSCSQTMVAPAFKDCGCAGGRVTLAERSVARRAARANYSKTLDACLAAASKGELEVVEGSELTTMEMTPVETAPPPEPECSACEDGKCKTVIIEEPSPRRALLRR